jgi:hypothetical protein
MTDQTPASTMRKERIERLLRELEYEVTRGIMEHEIDETTTFRFIIPISRAIPKGIVTCEFRTRPAHSYEAGFYGAEAPTLKVVSD